MYEEISKHDNLYKFIAIFGFIAALLSHLVLVVPYGFYILWYIGYYIRTNEDRKHKNKLTEQERIESNQAEEWKKQEKIKNDEYRRKIEQQERLEQIKKRKEEEIQAYSELRIEIEKMPISQRWKQNVREKCGNKCQICGSTGKLEIHHRDSFYLILKQNYITSVEEAFECKQLWDHGNGEALCKECHDKMESSKYRRLRI